MKLFLSLIFGAFIAFLVPTSSWAGVVSTDDPEPEPSGLDCKCSARKDSNGDGDCTDSGEPESQFCNDWDPQDFGASDCAGLQGKYDDINDYCFVAPCNTECPSPSPTASSSPSDSASPSPSPKVSSTPKPAARSSKSK